MPLDLPILQPAEVYEASQLGPFELEAIADAELGLGVGLIAAITGGRPCDPLALS